MKILIIEDDKELAYTLKDILEVASRIMCKSISLVKQISS